ncbi:MAG: tetratricopeptide repeat protein [Candidatus Marinimicrobia bacterium]|nr:tetratricopeptide repeat protein [Candidatus Neomarinimicrobiota bacterium]MCF7850661.1 tetratricopeptide repeat protein [Candidatus Neomarinimicrobiota bacterium]MCF7904464.1 tetratricopeptide repeat protein [Candidatus Neomarinimicrobiota bacterium]
MLTPKKKLTKKELKHDPLLDTLERGQEFYEANSKQILTGVGIVALAVLLTWGWMNSRDSFKNEAMLANTKTTMAAMQGMNSNVISELELVISEYGKNDLVALSALQLGSARLDSGDIAGARELFEHVAKNSDEFLRAAGKMKLAYLAERESEYLKAAKMYAAVSSMDLFSISKSAKLQAGYAYLNGGQPEKTRSIVDELLADELDVKFRQDVKYLEGKVQEK